MAARQGDIHQKEWFAYLQRRLPQHDQRETYSGAMMVSCLITEWWFTYLEQLDARWRRCRTYVLQ